MNKRIFVIDDEAGLIKAATNLLEFNKYVVSSDTSPKSALVKIRKDPPDLVLLDICMDEMDGLEVCKELKSDPQLNHIPIIMVSVKADEADVVIGLELGADDYVRKPLQERELLARIKTVLRRKSPAGASPKIECGPFRVDYAAYRVWIDGKILDLPPKQFEVLSLFLRNEGRVLTRGAISEKIWGADLRGYSRTVDHTVDRLRKLLGAYGRCIQGLKGVGYRFEVGNEEAQEELD